METLKAPDRQGAALVSERSRMAPPGAAASWNAPTTPSTPPAPPRPAGVTPEPHEVLDELTRVVPGARGAVLASVDGFTLARSASMPNEASHAAMLAAAMGLAHQLVQMGGGSDLRQLVVDHSGGLLLVWPIGATRVLAMLTASTVDQRRLRAFVQEQVKWLAGSTA